MERRVGFLGVLIGGSLFLLVSAALAQRIGDPGPVPSQVKEGQAAPTQPVMNNVVEKEDGQLLQEEQNDAGGTGATEKAGGEQGVGEITALLREHLPASLSLEYATLLITVVTLIFAIFLGAFGYFEWARFKKLQVDLESQRRELAEESQTLRTRVETFKADLKMQEQRLVAYQRFLEAVLLNHSNLLVGVIEGFGSALKPEEDRRLRSLIFEAEAVLDLFHPDNVKVVNALWHLEQIGADNAVPSIVQLRDDSAADSDIRVRAQIVLSKIQERLKEERKKRSRVESPGGRPRHGAIAQSGQAESSPELAATGDQADSPRTRKKKGT